VLLGAAAVERQQRLNPYAGSGIDQLRRDLAERRLRAEHPEELNPEPGGLFVGVGRHRLSRLESLLGKAREE